MSAQLVRSTIEPFFFGPPTRQLYGCYHEPSSWPVREVAVLLCYPFGHEMIRSHRAFRHLAARMAQAGFPTLRFDAYGTGDAAGDTADTTLEGWIGDIGAAVEELRARSGADAVVLAGLRLGATLALLAAPTVRDVAGLIAWEPVCSGVRYLEELRALHEAAISRFFVLPKDHVATSRPTELLGFAMPAALRAGIERTDLLQIPPLRGRPQLLLESQGAAEMAALAAHLGAAAPVTHEIIPSFTVWVEDVDKGLVPQPLIEAMTRWLEGTFT